KKFQNLWGTYGEPRGGRLCFCGTGDLGPEKTRGQRQMRKLEFTTAIALALAGAAFVQEQHTGGGAGGPEAGGGAGGGPGVSAPAGGSGPGANFSAPRGPSGPTTSMGPNRAPGTLYNQSPTNMNKQGGPNFDKDRNRFSDHDPDRFSDRDRDRRLFNRADRDHDFDRDRNFEGGRNFDHRGVVRGNFFEHGRHFRFPRF